MNLNPLKYCFHGQHSRPRATFRTLPGVRNKRAVCAECYEKIIADRKQKKLAAAARTGAGSLGAAPRIPARESGRGRKGGAVENLRS